jgi:ERF superfamily
VSVSTAVLEQIKEIILQAGGVFDGVQDDFGAHLPRVTFYFENGPKALSVPVNPDKFNVFNFTKMVREEIEFQGTPMSKKTEGAPATITLREKLHNVYTAISHVEKAGHNQLQNYDYVRSADVMHAIRKALVAQRVYAEINFNFVGEPYTIARAKTPAAPFSAVNVQAFVMFRDLDSLETLTASGLGTGADVGDKAAYKAQTGALKYALKNAFLVPDEAGMDPEADRTVDEGADWVPDAPGYDPNPAPQAVERPQRAPEPPAEVLAATFGPSVSSAPEPAPAPAAPPMREPGDEPLDLTLPNEEQLSSYRGKFTTLGDDLSANGGLKASRGLRLNAKLLVFLLQSTGQKDAAAITVGQWEAFFARVEAAKVNPAAGLKGIAKLVNKANGIEEK